MPDPNQPTQPTQPRRNSDILAPVPQPVCEPFIVKAGRKQIKIGRQLYQGSVLLTIREVYNDAATGKLIHTKSGITVSDEAGKQVLMCLAEQYGVTVDWTNNVPAPTADRVPESERLQVSPISRPPMPEPPPDPTEWEN